MQQLKKSSSFFLPKKQNIHYERMYLLCNLIPPPPKKTRGQRTSKVRYFKDLWRNGRSTPKNCMLQDFYLGRNPEAPFGWVVWFLVYYILFSKISLNTYSLRGQTCVYDYQKMVVKLQIWPLNKALFRVC